MRHMPMRLVAPRFLPGAALVAAILLVATPVSSQQDLRTLVRQSGFIFAGQIEKIGAATTGLSASAQTAVVRVVRVIDEQPPIDEVKGRDVTVRLRDPKTARVGLEAVFFTYLYGGGMSLGLQEVAEMPDDGKVDEVVHAARAGLADDALRSRLDTASIVATARVLRTERVEGPPPRGEHEPMWWNATLEVASPLKGDVKAGATITVRFPSNYDAYWGNAPKPTPGETAIFLMQPARMVPAMPMEKGEREGREDLTGLFLLDRLDQLKASEIERVRRLLAK